MPKKKIPVDLPPFDPKGARCQHCQQRMLEASGCTVRFYEMTDGRRIAPLKYGDEPEDWGAKDGHRCHDCGVKPGGAHHPGCDVERCPVCFAQAICCDHMDGAKIMVVNPSPPTISNIHVDVPLKPPKKKR